MSGVPVLVQHAKGGSSLSAWILPVKYGLPWWVNKEGKLEQEPSQSDLRGIVAPSSVDASLLVCLRTSLPPLITTVHREAEVQEAEESYGWGSRGRSSSSRRHSRSR